MPKQNKKEDKKINVTEWIIVAALAFAVGCSTFLLIKNFQTQELVCQVKGMDQLTGLVVLECVK